MMALGALGFEPHPRIWKDKRLPHLHSILQGRTPYPLIEA